MTDGVDGWEFATCWAINPRLWHRPDRNKTASGQSNLFHCQPVAKSCCAGNRLGPFASAHAIDRYRVMKALRQQGTGPHHAHYCSDASLLAQSF